MTTPTPAVRRVLLGAASMIDAFEDCGPFVFAYVLNALTTSKHEDTRDLIYQVLYDCEAMRAARSQDEVVAALRAAAGGEDETA